MMNKTFYLTLFVFLGLSSAIAGADPNWGADAASSATNFTIDSMLSYAIQDEYLARAEYRAIQKRFGAQRPFSNIQRSEENHIAWLVDAYKSYGLPVPKDDADRYVKIPASLKEAFQTGVDAEIANIEMYDKFLAQPLLARAENSALRSLFTRLRDASKNHLQAFRTGLSRY